MFIAASRSPDRVYRCLSLPPALALCPARTKFCSADYSDRRTETACESDSHRFGSRPSQLSSCLSPQQPPSFIKDTIVQSALSVFSHYRRPPKCQARRFASDGVQAQRRVWGGTLYTWNRKKTSSNGEEPLRSPGSAAVVGSNSCARAEAGGGN
ncbi:hypothetical protein AAFF_G00412610 [Aldrovandia affinis]|uniref:Uncharacterized protein n=1 Tax=Aldrovandia affinis TaxID=143900 RepID=A0AAD7WJL6_9TELE|nr:hypothetical protein AAFF_G00412610 [Aldrovandia affinis]